MEENKLKSSAWNIFSLFIWNVFITRSCVAFLRIDRKCFAYQKINRWTKVNESTTRASVNSPIVSKNITRQYVCWNKCPDNTFWKWHCDGSLSKKRLFNHLRFRFELDMHGTPAQALNLKLWLCESVINSGEFWVLVSDLMLHNLT